MKSRITVENTGHVVSPAPLYLSGKEGWSHQKSNKRQLLFLTCSSPMVKGFCVIRGVPQENRHSEGAPCHVVPRVENSRLIQVPPLIWNFRPGSPDRPGAYPVVLGCDEQEEVRRGGALGDRRIKGH